MFQLYLKFFTAFFFALISQLLIINDFAFAQLSDRARWASTLTMDYRMIPNITYLKANNVELKLDVYTLRNPEEPVPTLIYFHGGGWISGIKENILFDLFPYVEMGWAVVNVQYRLANVSHAPAAVEDGLCALRWVIRQADKYGFDINKLVVSGNSAGGHLALTTGMLTASGLDSPCPGNEELKVAAIVNWSGVTDVADLVEGENIKSYAVEWLGSRTDRMEIAKRVSPLNYLRSDLPPIISIHGDADTLVPYSQVVQLHQGLERLKVPNKLITIPNGGHARFTRDETLYIYENIHKFLDTHIVNKKLEN